MQEIELTSTCVQTGYTPPCLKVAVGRVFAGLCVCMDFFMSQMPVKILTEDIHLLVSWSVKKLVQLQSVILTSN